MNVEIDTEFKALIPPLKPEEKEQLEQSILKEGCRDALVVWNGILLDGHNRIEICEKHGIPYQTKEAESIQDRTDAKIWIRNNQMGRRNLTDAWRIELALANKEDLLKKGIEKREQNLKQNIPDLSFCDKSDEPHNTRETISDLSIVDTSGDLHNTRETIAKEAGVGTGTIARAEIVRSKAPELWEKAKEGEITISAAYKEVKSNEKKHEREKQIEEIKQKIESEIENPSGLYDVIVIDPPWNYGREYDPDSSRVASPYPEMTQDELLKLEIPAKDDSVLFLWTTHAFLWNAKELLDAWGFAYKAMIVWDKDKMGMGKWLRMQCEFCLVGIKGKPLWENTTYRDIIRESRREHSRKPDFFYKMIDSITVGRKLDYFSREKREGWDTWGAEDGKLGK
jgi:N6-adenosine-specific RNA methylase IME4